MSACHIRARITGNVLRPKLANGLVTAHRVSRELNVTKPNRNARLILATITEFASNWALVMLCVFVDEVGYFLIISLGFFCLFFGLDIFYKGYEGKYCEIKKNFCESDPCLNSGICVNRDDDFKCLCQPGTDFKHLKSISNI